SGGIYAAQSIAPELPERGQQIIDGWNLVQSELAGSADGKIHARASRAVAGLQGFIERMAVLFSGIGPVPDAAQLLLLERNHDDWLDYRTALVVFTDVMRQRVAEKS